MPEIKKYRCGNKTGCDFGYAYTGAEGYCPQCGHLGNEVHETEEESKTKDEKATTRESYARFFDEHEAELTNI